MILSSPTAAPRRPASEGRSFFARAASMALAEAVERLERLERQLRSFAPSLVLFFAGGGRDLTGLVLGCPDGR